MRAHCQCPARLPCRVAGNIATSEQVASLEYAVAELNVKLILILGHQRCGAVHAALAGEGPWQLLRGARSGTCRAQPAAR
jgi:hypothetical protein